MSDKEFIHNFMDKNFVFDASMFFAVHYRDNTILSEDELYRYLQKFFGYNIYRTVDNIISDWFSHKIRLICGEPRNFLERCSVVLKEEWTIVDWNNRVVNKTRFISLYKSTLSESILSRIYEEYIIEHAEWYTKYAMRMS